jgi:hypothetical protein
MLKPACEHLGETFQQSFDSVCDKINRHP